MKRKKPQPVQMKKSEDQLHVGTIGSLTVTRYRMPKYNGFVCRGGPHGDLKYNRTKSRKSFERLLQEWL